MCPEEIADALWWLIDLDLIDPDELSLRASATRTLPIFALCLRLQSDPMFGRWVSELHELEPTFREARASELVKGAPRKTGRELLTHLLLVAAKTGRASRVMTLCSFAAPPNAPLNPHDPKRRPKNGRDHAKCLSLAQAADRVVRRLVAYPLGIEAECNSEAQRKAENRLIKAAAARAI